MTITAFWEDCLGEWAKAAWQDEFHPGAPPIARIVEFLEGRYEEAPRGCTPIITIVP